VYEFTTIYSFLLLLDEKSLDRFSVQSRTLQRISDLLTQSICINNIYANCHPTETCWDCALGNGQGGGCAIRFYLDQVFATDIKEQTKLNIAVSYNQT